MYWNCKLEYIRHIHVYVEYQTMVEGTVVLRRCLTNGCLVWCVWVTNYSTTNTYAYVLLLNSTTKLTTFTWKIFNNHTRHPFVEYRLRITRYQYAKCVTNRSIIQYIFGHKHRREYSKYKLCAWNTTTLNLSANVTTRFVHLQMWTTVPSKLVRIIKIPIR